MRFAGGMCDVSTHSRPKAAGSEPVPHKRPNMGFNTQPPEGGWVGIAETGSHQSGFQHTAARRRLAAGYPVVSRSVLVSTHSRPKAAGQLHKHKILVYMCFNTQPPEGGWFVAKSDALVEKVFQHTAARRRLVMRVRASRRLSWFQHTAARRRLEFAGSGENFAGAVSTHSRPKAAGCN